MKKHKCEGCGSKIFKVKYNDTGMVDVYCNSCGESALFTIISLSNIPFENISMHKLDGHPEE